ncbi:type II nitroreductase [Diatrype stigma]|uniref:Type II nitroreductase n=1 Tax=Diatrype stigma TaxID=117547 RepID=A0AAN9V1L5_9PEZI
MSLSPRSLLTWVVISALHCWVILLVTNSPTFNRLSLFLNPFSTFTSSLSSSSQTPITAATPFLDAIKARRTYYALNKTLPISHGRITQIVEEAIQAVPSAFNSQSNRAVVLLGAEHDALWDIAADVLKNHVSEEQWDSTSQRIAGFKAASGTILLFADEKVMSASIANAPTYATQFPAWAAHSEGMLQLALWTALELEGLGANLQHYNPLIDARVTETWQVPASWRLRAQLVFGGRSSTGLPRQKSVRPVEEKLRVFGAE